MRGSIESDFNDETTSCVIVFSIFKCDLSSITMFNFITKVGLKEKVDLVFQIFLCLELYSSKGGRFL